MFEFRACEVLAYPAARLASLGVDRLFDMLRTAVNVTGDASCAVIMDRFSKNA